MNEERVLPTVEEMMVRMALEELTSRQREIWELYNFEKMTQEDIATKLRIKHQAVDQCLKTITRKVAKWCKLNRGAYMLMKMNYKIMNDE